MISNLPPDYDGRSVDAVVGCILAEMHAVRDNADLDSLCFDEETARGVAAFLEDGNASPHQIGAARLRELTARALFATGRSELANRVLLMGGGLVRESRSALCCGGVMVILDLRRVVVRRNERLDMILFMCLSAILGRTAGLWKKTDGRGVLGLRNVRATAESLLGGRGRRKQVLRLSTDIVQMCGSKLDRLRESQHWSDRPLVVNMDCL